MLAVLFAVFLGLLAFGLYLAVTGLRGRSVAGTRECSTCGFDVQALTAGAGTVSRCPECGGDILASRGTRLARARAQGRGLAGVGMAALACMALVALIFSSSLPMRAMPVAVLAWQLESGDTSLRDAATRELQSRRGNGVLTNRQFQSLSPALLKLQADRTLAWQPEWGLLLEAAHAAGVLTLQEQQQYLTQAVDIHVRHRQIASEKETLQLGLTIPSVRTGNLVIQCVVAVPPSTATEPVKYASYGLPFASDGAVQIPQILDSGVTRQSTSMSATVIVTAAAGMHEVQHDLRFALAAPGWHDAATTIARTTSLEVVNRPGPFARPVPNPAPAEEIARAISFSHVAGQSAVGVGSTPGIAISNQYSTRGKREPTFQTMCTIAQAPQPLAFEVFVRRAGDEQAPWLPLMTCRSSANPMDSMGNGSVGTPVPLELLGVDSVDVLLRGSAKVADSDIDMREYWPGEVLLRSVPVDRTPLTNELESARAGGTSTPELSRIELVEAMHAGTLTADQAEREIESLLVTQATMPDTWTPQDGDLLEMLRAKQFVTDAQYLRYLRHIVAPVTLTMRPRVKLERDGSLPITGRTGRYRSGSTSDLTLVWDTAVVTLNGQPVRTDAVPRARSIREMLARDNANAIYVMLPIVAHPVSPPGEYTLAVSLPYRLFRGTWTLDTLSQAGEPLLTSSIEASTMIKLIADDEPLVVPVDHPDIAGVLDASLACTSVWFNLGRGDSSPFAGMTVRADALPVAAAFDTFFRVRADTDRDNWWYAGQVALGPGESRQSGSGDNMPHRTLPRRNELPEAVKAALLSKDVELVLIPSFEAGASRTEISEAWRGDDKVRVLAVPAERIREHGR